MNGAEDPSRAAPEPEADEEEVGAGQAPDSIDAQPEAADYPGRGSPAPID